MVAVNHGGQMIVVLLADGVEVVVHYRNLDLVAGLLWDKKDIATPKKILLLMELSIGHCY